MHSFFRRLLQIGIGGLFVCIAKKLFFEYLAFRYGFDRWHASAPYECRPYKREVVALANSVSPNTVLEIGCGLGEILSRVNCGSRWGMDLDPKVLDGARLLHGDDCRFIAGNVVASESLLSLNIGPVDLMIMVNWPHGISWGDLTSSVRKLIGVLNVGYILIDGITGEQPGYSHHHGPDDFCDWGEIAYSLPSSDGVRTLYLVRVDQLSATVATA